MDRAIDEVAARVDKEAARAALRAIVIAHLQPLVQAQLDNARGISHFMLRDSLTVKFERVTDEARIIEALSAEGAENGKSYFYIYTKDPSVAAFTDLINRTLGKPVDAVELTHAGGMTIIHELSSPLAIPPAPLALLGGTD